MILLVRNEVESTLAAFNRFLQDSALQQKVAEVGQLLAETLLRGGKIMFAGNGGSAADSQHIAAEFVSRLACDRRPLPALALTVDTSILTAAGNDYGFETIFSRQILALGRHDDVFVGISTSGGSKNVLAALQAARKLGITTVGLTGESGTKMASFCDHLLCVPSSRTQNIQEMHIMIGHTLCAIAEKPFLGEE